jgi:hypothetical protein
VFADVGGSPDEAGERVSVPSFLLVLSGNREREWDGAEWNATLPRTCL